MPCYEPPGAYGEPTVESMSELNSNKARMLCHTLTMLEQIAPEVIKHLSSETTEWWMQHRTFDTNPKHHNEFRKIIS